MERKNKMPKLDLNSKASYKGSYTDNYISGAALVSKTSDSILTINSQRGSSISRYDSSLLGGLSVSTIIKPENYSNSFADYRTAITSAVTLINKNNRFIMAESETEYFYDSFVPDINEIFRVDGGNLVLLNIGRGFATQSLMFEYIFGGTAYSPVENMILSNSLFSTSSNGTRQVSNDKWVFSFPFEIKYRNAKRLQGKPFSPESLYYSISGSVNLTDKEDGIYFNHDSGDLLRPITKFPEFIALTDGFWGNLSGQPEVLNYPTNIFFGFLFPSKSIDTVGLPYTTNNPIHGLFADKTNGLNNALNFTTNPVKSASLQTNIKFVYGFGDGFQNFGKFITDEKHNIETYRNESVFFGSLIRGWKYGLKSGFPEKSKVLMHNKFQEELKFKHSNRLYSAMFDTKKKSLAYPLKISFLSGSAASIINQTSSLNTRDSGIYDSFYRAGRPFFE